MSDLINRYGVSAWLESWGQQKLADMVMEEKRFPSADAVEVIRCKDCKFGQQSFGKLRCSVNCRTMRPDDFCNYGEVTG